MKKQNNINFDPVFILVLLISLFETGFTAPCLRQNGSGTTSSNIFLESLDQPLDPYYLNQQLLEKAILYFTNQTRRKNQKSICLYEEKLHTSAQNHSREMSRLNYFSHTSPVVENKRLEDRLKRAGLSLSNTIMGENIGVDYYLKIANRPFYKKEEAGRTVYIEAETHKPIQIQTYREFGESMVKSWMKSPGHRKNILNQKFNRIGIGVAAGTYKQFRAIYVTQHFMGPLDN